MRRALRCCAFLAACFGTGAAWGAETFAGLKAKDCIGGTVPNARLRDVALAQEKIPLSTEIAKALIEGKLGSLSAQREVDCLAKVCEGSDLALANLHHHLLDLGEAAPAAPAGFTIKVDEASAPVARDRPAAFLNGSWEWVAVTCTTVQSAGPAAPPKPVRRPSDVAAPEVVLGKNEDDAGKDFKKRGFATLGLSADREAHKTSWDIDAYLGLNAPFLGLGSETELQPFVSFQYHTGKKVDDLSVGAAFMWYPGNAGHLVRLKGAWETDHRFRSSLWRGDLGWTPPWLDGCERTSVPDKHYATCEITFVGDFQDVRDPGDKADLADLQTFGRFGFDSRFTAGQSLGDEFGFATASAGFSVRQHLWGKESDAALFTASLGLVPSDAAHWKISLDYTRGRDLTDLSKQDKIVLTVGLRR